MFVAQNSMDGRDSYFHMTGGSITGNDSTVYGGGVRIAEYSAMTVSGGATIQDNFKGGTLSGGVYVQGSGEKSNTVLNGKAITVTGTLTGSIGVVKEDDYLEGKDSIQIAQSDISYQITQSDAARFTSDSSDCTTAYSNIGSKPVVLLKLPVVYNVTYNANGAASGSVPTDSTDYAAGSSVTVLANSGNLQKACGTFGGWNTKADGSGDSYAAGSGSFSISADTVLYAQWTEAHTFDADGFCEAVEGETHFQPAVLNGDVYEISNAGQIYWFAEKVNGGDKTINGKLMKDIDLSVSRAISWVPIGQNSVYYSGSFNGGGHAVSNLYINNEADYQGFFGKFNGSLTSLTVTGEIHSRSYSGGICGNMGINGSISNCTNAADILSTGNWVGGIVGYNYGEISNCRNLAGIQGARTVGGICGFNNQAKDWDAEPPVVTSWGTIKNCYNTGAVTGAAGSEAGGICGTSTPAKGAALFDNYCIDSVTYGCSWSEDGAKGFLKGAVESKTAEQFASGEVTYLLNNGKTDGTQVWLQAIGTDSLPQFTGAAVYQVEQYDCPADTSAAIAYSNTDSEIRGTEHSFTHYTSNDDATCTADGTKTAQCDYCDETNTVADVGSTREHNCEHHEAKAATCTEIGWEAYDTCKDCDYTTYVETPAKGHSYVPHVEVPATHKADGIAGHFTCENCKKLFNKNKNEVTAENLVIAKLSHSFSGEWKSDEANHWHACSCGEKSSLLAHTFAWVTDKEATKTAAGSKHEKCTVCGYEKAAVEIPATGTSAPRTGDTSNMGLWIVLLFVSATGIIGAAVYGKKRKKQAK